ncbi:MAG: hypothetical protein QY320_05255 [Gammaproteobacteria bacterium]|nr:MAG: hypothetical protein QY320_05255 [Gammaproteobacteria bacterium]
MQDSPQQRTAEVLTQLKTGLDGKLLRGGTEIALQHLESAYGSARTPIRLDPPWPQITAYRLAHILMRRGAETPWDRIDELLSEATQGDVLGPAPLIYRLVSLSRLHSNAAPSQELLAIYHRAIDLISIIQAGQEPQHRTERAGQRHSSILQPVWIDLLELAAYFTDLPYQPLEGRVDLNQDIFSDLGIGRSAWRVVERLEDAGIHYPESTARARIEARRQALGACLAIEYNGERYAKAHCPDDPTKSQALNRTQFEDLRDRMTGRYRPRQGPAPDDMRVRKMRLKKALKRCGADIDTGQFDAWWANPGDETSIPASTPLILLLGPDGGP